ncbi:hypothetical protein CCHR01_12688 [Colletotrichum chrysophilum]|uniref:Uncharacterized protein n=1 Tax=Colletotrichum chrysophilum TaxID=1836956 RepID=A0AAD9AAV2_9PEZI|nr:hypothetical protein CCHR01_12688 [Colletotrichum chrysophilum]
MQRRAARSLMGTPVSAVSSYISRISISLANANGPMTIYFAAGSTPPFLRTTIQSGHQRSMTEQRDHLC